eukprot:gene20164-26900_t
MPHMSLMLMLAELDSDKRKLRDATYELDADVQMLIDKLAELDSDKRKLRDATFELDADVSELSHRLGTAEGSNRSLEDENGRLKSQNQTLAQERHEKEIAVNEARAKAAALEDKVASSLEMLEQSRSRIRDLETSVRQLESRCTDLRDAAAGHDIRAKDAQAEVLKGNQIIEKLSNDIKLTKEKARRKTAIVMRQEEELQQRDQGLNSAMRENQGLNQAIDSIKVTEAQLQGTGALPGSRYSFSSTARGTPAAALPAPVSTPAAGLSMVAHSTGLGSSSVAPPSRYSSSVGYGTTSGVTGVSTGGRSTQRSTGSHARLGVGSATSSLLKDGNTGATPVHTALNTALNQ